LLREDDPKDQPRNILAGPYLDAPLICARIGMVRKRSG